MSSFDEESIVIDAGSASVKVGYSGEDTPRSVFPSTVIEDGEPATHEPAESGLGGGRRPEAIERHEGELHLRASLCGLRALCGRRPRTLIASRFSWPKRSARRSVPRRKRHLEFVRSS